MFNNQKYFLFSILKNIKYSVFIGHFLIAFYFFICFLRVILRNNYTNM